MGQVWATFDDWALTNVGQRNGMLQMGGWGQDAEVAASWTALQGEVGLTGSVAVGRGTGGPGAYRWVRCSGGTIQNGRLWGRWVVPSYWAGIYGRGRDTNDGDSYLMLTRADNGNLELFRSDNGGLAQLGATAAGYTGGEIVTGYISFDSGGVACYESLKNVTVARVADATYTAAGNVGMFGGKPASYWDTIDWIQIYSSANAGTAISTTYDAGSSVSYNALCADLSANGGSATFEVLGSDNAAGPHSTLDSGLAMTNGTTALGATRTARYWQVQTNFIRSNATQNVGISAGSVRLANGPSGGGTTTNVFLRHGAAGGGEGKRRTRIVVLTDSEARAIRRAARKQYPKW